MKIVSAENVKFNEVFMVPIKHKANGFQAVNVLIGNISEEDIEALFGPLTGIEEFVAFDSSVVWGHVLKALGIFPSVSQARKNGWEEIECGFHEAIFKKKRKVLFVLKEGSRDQAGHKEDAVSREEESDSETGVSS